MKPASAGWLAALRAALKEAQSSSRGDPACVCLPVIHHVSNGDQGSQPPCFTNWTFMPFSVPGNRASSTLFGL